MISTGELCIDVKEKEIKVSETNKCQDLEVATNKVLQRIAAEPAYRIVLYKILEYCDPVRHSSDVERTILAIPEMKGAMHSPQLLLSWLKDVGAIEQRAAEKGEVMWCTTSAGRNAVSKESYDSSLVRLLAQEFIYQDIYLQVLQACLSPKSRMEIETMLKGNPILEEPKVYPSFFIENLEEARGLEWDEKWKTTSDGKVFLNGQAKFQT
jgi:hypothetical protein